MRFVRSFLFLGASLSSATAMGSGVEFPDNGAIAIGRGGAYAANPDGILAIQHNPAGLAQQEGLRLGFESKLVDMNIKYTCSTTRSNHVPCTPGTIAQNQFGIFHAPAGGISYGFGELGPLTGFTAAIGAHGPSAVGRSLYDAAGPQRYGLIESDFFIAYLSAAVALELFDLISVGVTGQLAVGRAKFVKANYSGTLPQGVDNTDFDTIGTVDVSGSGGTAVIGATITPTDDLAIGVSWRPRHEFIGTGTLETQLPAIAAAVGATRTGDQAEFIVRFPDILRVGVQYKPLEKLAVEANFVYEAWSPIQQLDVIPQGITLTSPSLTGEKELPLIPILRNYSDAWSIRLGGDWEFWEDRLAVRAGWFYEKSAVKPKFLSFESANWDRNALSVGASVRLFGIWVDAAYAHHFVPSINVVDSKHTQTVTPCLSNGCTDTEPRFYGDGDYEADYNVIAFSLRVPFSDLSLTP